jgi:hypothetical protein
MLRATRRKHPLLWKRHDKLSVFERLFGVLVSEEDYWKFRREIEGPRGRHMTAEEKEAWAIYSAHMHKGTKHRQSRFLVKIVLVILALLALGLFLPHRLHAAPPPELIYHFSYVDEEGGTVHLNIPSDLFASPQFNPLQRVNVFQIAGITPTLTGSSLNVNCTGGCAAGTSFSDNGAFTAGTTAISITGGWFSNSPTVCTSGSACAPSLTSDRKLFVQAFQGTSPWVISGSLSANQSVNLAQWAATTLGVPTNFGTTPGAVIAGSVNSSTFIGTVAAVAASAGVQKVGIAGGAGTSLETTAGVLDNNLKNINNSAVSTAATGVQKVGVVGNAGGIFDTTQNAAVPANALSIGCNFTTAPASLTTGNQGAAQCNSKGELLTQLTDGTTNVAVIAGTAALKTDMSSIAGTATSTAAAGVQLVGIEGRAGTSLETTAGVLDYNLKNVNNAAVSTAASGVQKVGVVGNAGGVFDAAGTNVAAPANEVLTACQFVTAPTTLTSTNVGPLQCNSKGEALTQLTDGTTNVSVIAATNAVKTDMSSVAGTATVTAAAGVQKVGVVGNAGAIFDAANNSAVPANVLSTGAEAATQGSTQPTAATAGNIRRTVESTDGAQYVRLGGPVTWSCGAPFGTTLTSCQGAPGAGLKLYVQTIYAQSSTATASLWILETGTGTNCGTGTATVFPVGATAGTAIVPSLGNTAAPTVIQLQPPIAVTANQAICVVGSSATNTSLVTITGYSAP